MKQHAVQSVGSVGSVLSVLFLASAAIAADVPDEFKVKREAVFEFAQKPVVTRNGDNVTIAFETKGLCDVTVAIENAEGRIIRHLVSGVLGPKAPEPFQKDSKKQTVVWDGKNDQEAYVDNKDACTVRVSLGLKPQFEKTLFWSPHKNLVAGSHPMLVAAPEGVYVYEASGIESIRLFDHSGNYLRTVYPFPADKLATVKGLRWQDFPQDGAKLPLRNGTYRASLLTSGSSAWGGKPSRSGRAGTAFTVRGDRIALAMSKLGRLATDGTSGGLDLTGPKVTYPGALGDYYNDTGMKSWQVEPRSAAFSPDGKWLYLAGFSWNSRSTTGWRWLHGVVRMEYAGDAPPTVFAGNMEQEKPGQDERSFRVPTSVDTDAAGRVYVSDYSNNRIQVFSTDGKLLKSVPAKLPALVRVHQRTGDIYVFSWNVCSLFNQLADGQTIPATLAHLGPFEDPRVVATYPLTTLSPSGRAKTGGFDYSAALDSWADPATIWLYPGSGNAGRPLQILTEKDGKLEMVRDFAKDIAATVVRLNLPHPVSYTRQRLYVSPLTGQLYVGEPDGAVGQAFCQVLEIAPDTGKVKVVDLPFSAEELAIDLNGCFYLRSDSEVARYEPGTWREIPWDYGEEMKDVGFRGPMDGKTTSLMGGLALPSVGRPVWWHMGGMAVNARGNLAVTCHNSVKAGDRREGQMLYADLNQKANYKGREQKGGPYTPKLYPGRALGWETHIWDEHGKVLCEDATPGLAASDGIGLDRDNNLYVLAAVNRILDGKPYFQEESEALIKISPKKGKVVSLSPYAPVPLTKESGPARPPDGNMFQHGKAWADGAEWLYGGVGISHLPCVCWNARPALDLFARSFAPELDHCSVAVLDSSGNLILRVGRYGNVEDGKPLIPAGGPANPRSIGGDEVALFYAPYLGTHTDRRLFIADPGNQRIASVKLGYHAEEKTALKDVPDAGKK